LYISTNPLFLIIFLILLFKLFIASYIAKIRNIKAKSIKLRSLLQFLPSYFEDSSFNSKEKSYRQRCLNLAKEAG